VARGGARDLSHAVPARSGRGVSQLLCPPGAVAGIPRARLARNAGTGSMHCGSMSGNGGARDAGPRTTATSMPHVICWRRAFASWPVVMTGTCAWMREMHAQKKTFWCRCSQRKREAGIGIEPVWNRRVSASSAVKNGCHSPIRGMGLTSTQAVTVRACSTQARPGYSPVRNATFYRSTRIPQRRTGHDASGAALSLPFLVTPRLTVHWRSP
jgi:hypothetical protein